TSIELLPPESPLWKAPNLFITPHTSAVSDRLWHRETALLMDLLERWFDEREMFNQVDFARGYSLIKAPYMRAPEETPNNPKLSLPCRFSRPRSLHGHTLHISVSCPSGR